MRSRFLLCVAAALVAPLSAFAADWATSPSFYTHDLSNGQRVAQYQPIGPFYYFTRPDYLKSGYRQYRSTIDLGNSSDNMHVVEQWGAAIQPYEQWRFNFRPYSVPYSAWGPPYGGLGGGTGGYPYSGGNGFGGGGANIYGGFFPGYGFGGFGGFGGGPGFGGFGGGFGGVPFIAPGGGGAGMGVPGLAAPGMGGPGMGMGGGGMGGGGMGGGGMGGGPGMGMGGGGIPWWLFQRLLSPPANNFAQPWMDGHYPSYDLNDRSQYFRSYP